MHGAPVLISADRDRMGWKCHRQSFSLSSHPLLIAECDRPPTFQQKQSVGLTPLTKIKLSQLVGQRLNNDRYNYGDLLETMVTVVHFLREILTSTSNAYVNFFFLQYNPSVPLSMAKLMTLT